MVGGGEVIPRPVPHCSVSLSLSLGWELTSDPHSLPVLAGTGGRGRRRYFPSPRAGARPAVSPEVRVSWVLTLLFQMAPFPSSHQEHEGVFSTVLWESLLWVLGGELTGAWAPLRTGSPEFLCSQRLVHPEPLGLRQLPASQQVGPPAAGSPRLCSGELWLYSLVSLSHLWVVVVLWPPFSDGAELRQFIGSLVCPAFSWL